MTFFAGPKTIFLWVGANTPIGKKNGTRMANVQCRWWMSWSFPTRSWGIRCFPPVSRSVLQLWFSHAREWRGSWIPNGGFHSHGGTQNGWFIFMKIPWINGWFRGTPNISGGYRGYHPQMAWIQISEYLWITEINLVSPVQEETNQQSKREQTFLSEVSNLSSSGHAGMQESAMKEPCLPSYKVAKCWNQPLFFVAVVFSNCKLVCSPHRRDRYIDR